MPVIEVVQKVWVPEVPDIELPYEDGEPLESHWHRLQINLSAMCSTSIGRGARIFLPAVICSCITAWSRPVTAIEGPDFFVVKGVDRSRQRCSWIVWQEGGRYPDVIIELLSPTTIEEDSGPKKELYEQVFKTFEYFCVNPDGHALQGWRLVETRYVAIQPNERGWLWSESLQLWLGFQEGHFQGTPDMWVRFFTPSGALVPTSGEAVEAERERAEGGRSGKNTRLRAELERLQRG